MEEKNILRIAIDGPGGSGKSTVAKILAKKLEVIYIDTGAMYRAMALKVLKNNIDINNQASLQKVIEHTTIDFKQGDIFLDGEKVTDQIRTADVSMMASEIAAIDIVRSKLVALQREIGTENSVVMDGRDIGTNVLPDAEYKYFMNATIEERARRRFEEIKKKSTILPNYEEVLTDLKKRDHNDTTRKLNPLTQAEDAKIIETTNMTIEDVVDYIIKEVNVGQN